ncbi:hypothetical protein H2203_001898 [Taxawa tesnikishii (nom. ined.)]|nr:hypothetical protein H2203_001898 [Dothideales sp. JES 119]
MGVTLSTHSTLAPISLASTITGFVSFAFTLATLLRVFWDNIMTLYSAPSEVHDYLTNLRTELYEERASLRALRKHHQHRQRRRRTEGNNPDGLAERAWRGPELDENAVRTMQDSVKHLIRKFKQIERPFLGQGGGGDYEEPPPMTTRTKRRGGGGGGGVGEAAAVAAAAAARKGAARGYTTAYDSDRDDWAYGNAPDYCNITLGKRFVWLRYRSSAIDLMQSLSRVQTRRIARQVGEVVVALHEYGNVFEDIDGDVQRLSARLNRVVGVRRVE